MKVICCYCGVTLKTDMIEDGLISHGACKLCAKKEIKKAKKEFELCKKNQE